MHNGNAATAGFSMVEMMVTVGLAAVVVLAAAPSMAAWGRQQRLKSSAHELARAVQFARQQAVLRHEPVRLSFPGPRGLAPRCYVVHTGTAGRCHCDPSGQGLCDDTGPPPLKAVSLAASDGVSLQANVASIVFSPEHGTASPTATLVLRSGAHDTLQHTVNLMGRGRTCSPDGGVSGSPRC